MKNLPDALERQTSAEPTPDGNTVHQWRLVGEGLVIDLSAFEAKRTLLGVWVQWMGAHANRPFTLDGELAERPSRCQAIGGGPCWCVVDASRGDRLVKQWADDRDDAPIWAALEALAAEVQW